MATERFIGDLGVVHATPDEVVVFGYFGHKIRANVNASDLAFIEFLDAADDINPTPENEVKAVRLVMDYLRSQVHPDDWALFWRTAKENGQTSVDLMATSHAIGEAMSGFPTGRPSGSRAGRRATARKSGAASRSRATRTPASPSRVVDGTAVETDRQTAVVDRAMELLDGRPDLKAAVWQAQTARESVGSRG